MKKIDSFDNRYLTKASSMTGTNDGEKNAIGYCMAMFIAGESVDYVTYRIAMNAVYRLGITSMPLGWDL